jgi:peptide/nickel transport system permease protein
VSSDTLPATTIRTDGGPEAGPSSGGAGLRLRGGRPHPVLQRIVQAVFVAFSVLVVAFCLVRLAPGDPVRTLLGDQATPELIATYEERLGLVGSPLSQFWSYLQGAVTGDLGTSLATNQEVTSIIARTLPVTLWLIAVTLTMAMLVATPLALVVALGRRPWVGHLFRAATSVSLATPVFFSGLVLILLLSMQLGIAPVAGYQPGFPGNLEYLWLPALVNCGVLVPVLSRVLHSSLVQTLDEEFVETGIVRGVSRRRWFWRYLLRPSLAPTVALIGYMIGQMMSSAVVVEIIFGLPGIGTELVEAVYARDYAVVQGTVMVFGLIVVLISLAGDLLSRWLDRRVELA